MELLEQPIATAEFLVLDTETNGLGGERCELTEVGAVLVGGGELHERWASLVATSAPLRRGIQRFTGISQAMVDEAPAPEQVLAPLTQRLQGRVMVAHNAPFDRRVLVQAFERAQLEWPAPPVICTAALARAMLPLQRERRLGAVADALGIEDELAHRALPDAETCARVLCALFPRLCANATTIAQALALLAPRRRRAPARRRTTAVLERPQLEFRELPRDPGVYLFRDAAGRALYVGKSVSIRSRARAMDLARLDRRLPGDELGAGRVGAREPADQGAPAARQHPPGGTRRSSGLHPLPTRHPVSDPRGGAGPGGRARGD